MAVKSLWQQTVGGMARSPSAQVAFRQMALGRCSRCDKTRPGGYSPLGPAELPSTPPGSLPQAWGTFHGEDVCPDCQKPHEREQLAWRIVSAIAAEVDRRKQDGVPSDDMEAALIAHALSLREQLEALGAAGAEEPAPAGFGDTSHTAADRPSERRLRGSRADEAAGSGEEQRVPHAVRVAVTGAFLTGKALAVRLPEYDRLRDALADELHRPGWNLRDVPSARGTYQSGGGFEQSLPLVVARREGHDLVGQLQYGLREPRPGAELTLAQDAPHWSVEPCAMTIDVYDLGVAVLTAWLEVSAPAGLDPPAVMQKIKDLVWLRPSTNGSLSPVARSLQKIAAETVEDYARAVDRMPAAQVERPWLGERSEDSGRLLWLHPVGVVRVARPTFAATRARAPVFHRLIRIDDAVFAAGIGWSAIVATEASRGASTPVRLTQLHWAYYALFMQFDRGLVQLLNSARHAGEESRKDLEDEAEAAFSDYLRVMEARARLDSELQALGGDELAIWDAISDVQRFDSIVDGVERKIDVLQRLTQRRADQAAAKRARNMSETLMALGALTLITVATGIVGYLVGAKESSDAHNGLRIGALVAACLGALTVLSIAYRAVVRDLRRRMSRRRARRRSGTADRAGAGAPD